MLHWDVTYNSHTGLLLLLILAIGVLSAGCLSLTHDHFLSSFLQLLLVIIDSLVTIDLCNTLAEKLSPDTGTKAFIFIFFQASMAEVKLILYCIKELS